MASTMSRAFVALLLLMVVFFVDQNTCEEGKTEAAEDGYKVEVTKQAPDNCWSYRPDEVEAYQRRVQEGDGVFMDYQVYDGSNKLDSSFDNGRQYSFTVGSGAVIKQVDKAIREMCVGEQRKISLPYKFGETFPMSLSYGEEKNIAPNATLEIFVTLRHIFRPDEDKLIMKTMRDPPEDCPRRTQDKDYVHKHYSVYTKSNSKMVDSSIERRSEYHFTIGAGEVIQGMDIGIRDMCVGEMRRLYMPPHLAYGERGDGGGIPGHATLIFDIEVTHIHRPGRDNLQLEVIKAGPADCKRKVEAGDVIFKHYTGYLPNGTKFDSSFDRGKEYWFRVGAEPRQVIRGMDEGIRGLCVGEKRKITMPSLMAYGQTGVANKIPPHSPLIFEVELMHIYRPSEDLLKVEYTSNATQCEKRSRNNDTLSMHYTGYFTNGTIFDAAYAKDQVWSFVMGTGDAIKGLDDGMLGMCVGDKRRITMPPHLAFGMQGLKVWKIPPHCTVVFDVELTRIVQPNELKTEL